MEDIDIKDINDFFKSNREKKIHKVFFSNKNIEDLIFKETEFENISEELQSNSFTGQLTHNGKSYNVYTLLSPFNESGERLSDKIEVIYCESPKLKLDGRKNKSKRSIRM